LDNLSARDDGFNDWAAAGRGTRMTVFPPLRVTRTIALVGLMGAGKSSIGRRLAQRLGLPFIDADTEIEAAAGATIEEIFQRHGEAAFRDGERRVIARLLESPPHVLATGGGAFMDASTRALIRARTVSIWLRADIELMLARVGRRSNRPLLKRGEPRAVLEQLMAQRYPIYAQADLTVDSIDGPPEATLERVLAALATRLGTSERQAAP
jgi:shikimate kinase